MEAFNLVGKDGNAFAVMGYTTNAMKTAYRDAAKNHDEDGMKTFGGSAQDAYTKDAMSSDYSHLICVSAEMIDKVNDYLCLEESYDEDDDYYDEDEDDYEQQLHDDCEEDEDDDWDQYVADNAYGSDTD